MAQQLVVGGRPHGLLQRYEQRQRPQILLACHGVVHDGQQYQPEVPLQPSECVSRCCLGKIMIHMLAVAL